MTTALVLVDIQKDFLPGGALAVAHGDEVVPVANRLMRLIPLVVATQDWHPADHRSFASQHVGKRVGEVVRLPWVARLSEPGRSGTGVSAGDGRGESRLGEPGYPEPGHPEPGHPVEQVLWPDHCVQGTPGARFAPGLDGGNITHVVRKGTDREIDSYSGFFDNGRRKATGMHELLTSLGVTDLVVVGLATDYCVRATVLDALSLGYGVRVVREGVRGVDLAAGDSERALREMESAGARLVSLGEIERGAAAGR